MNVQSRKKAIVTLALGSHYRSLFNELCRDNWQHYATRNDYDLIVVEEPLDSSPRATKRSPAWQKCLVFELPEVARYDQVAWVDADILIHPSAPCIFSGVAAENIGAVDAYGFPTPDTFKDLMVRRYAAWRANGTKYIESQTPSQFYSAWGLSSDADHVIQTGVLVASPRRHGPVFRRVYERYEDKGGAEWNYEMRPLSYELTKTGSVQWLDWRFNSVVTEIFDWNYPFVKYNLSGLVGDLVPKEPSIQIQRRIFQSCLYTAFDNSWFLHFAGCQQWMPILARMLQQCESTKNGTQPLNSG